MAARKAPMAPAGDSRRTPADHAAELKELVVGYAKQETIEPLVNLKRYLGWGLAGSMSIGLGCFLLMLALLRGLQAIDGIERTTGWLSLIPYVATLAVGVVIIALSAAAISRDSKKGARS